MAMEAGSSPLKRGDKEGEKRNRVKDKRKVGSVFKKSVNKNKNIG